MWWEMERTLELVWYMATRMTTCWLPLMFDVSLISDITITELLIQPPQLPAWNPSRYTQDFFHLACGFTCTLTSSYPSGNRTPSHPCDNRTRYGWSLSASSEYIVASAYKWLTSTTPTPQVSFLKPFYYAWITPNVYTCLWQCSHQALPTYMKSRAFWTLASCVSSLWPSLGSFMTWVSGLPFSLQA